MFCGWEEKVINFNEKLRIHSFVRRLASSAVRAFRNVHEETMGNTQLFLMWKNLWLMRETRASNKIQPWSTSTSNYSDSFFRALTLDGVRINLLVIKPNHEEMRGKEANAEYHHKRKDRDRNFSPCFYLGKKKKLLSMNNKSDWPVNKFKSSHVSCTKFARKVRTSSSTFLHQKIFY